MIKYHLTALALKCFASCKTALGLYRGLGNSLCTWKRPTCKMQGYFLERVEQNVALCRNMELFARTTPGFMEG
jgi:hypothetical protein